MARSKADLEQLLDEAETAIEEAASAIEAGDIQGAKSTLDDYLGEDEDTGSAEDSNS